jgi:hypothetical protein
MPKAAGPGSVAASLPEVSRRADEPSYCEAVAIPGLPDRDFRLDLFRGLSLWLIFIDHIPESYLNNFTPRNFGFSDAAEILVFLSGLASGIVYGGVAHQSGLGAATMRVLRRAFEIYAAQIITVVVLLAEVSLFAVRQPGLLDHANLAIFFTSPLETLFQAATLRYSPVNLDPLLLMVVLHFALVLILPAMIRWPNLTLTASVLLYLVSSWLDWSIPAYPRGFIFFNPLNWQLLYVIGMWWGMKPAGKMPGILRSPFLAGAAVVYLLLSFFITLGWRFHSLEAYVPAVVARLIYPIEKGDLDILRLIHFLALALLCWRLLPCDLPALRTRLLRPLVQCGEYSLAIYCISVLLSFAAHTVLSMGWNNLASQTLLSAGGIAVMAAAAGVLARMDRAAGAHPRTL